MFLNGAPRALWTVALVTIPVLGAEQAPPRSSISGDDVLTLQESQFRTIEHGSPFSGGGAL